MKLIFFLFFFIFIFPHRVFSSSTDLVKEEFHGWVIFKKYSDSEDNLFIAKEFRYNSDPIFFGYSFKKDKILDSSYAEKLWDKFDLEFETYLQKKTD